MVFSPGEIGDYILENNRIRIVIQDKGYSRGFGIYGGGVIDADRVRPIDEPTPGSAKGRDQFGELFPVAFLQAMEPTEVVVENDGSDGKTARIRVSGEGNDLITLSKVLNQVVLSSHELPDALLEAFSADNLNGEPRLRHQVVYELEPDARFLRIKVSLENISDSDVEIPSSAAGTAFGLFGISADGFNAPLGMVALFGAGNDIFIPGVGYDVRYGLEDAYLAGSSLPFPALPGLIAPGVMTTSKTGISYGLFSNLDETSESFVQNRFDADGKNVYEEAYDTTVDKNDVLVPFVASAFTGMLRRRHPISSYGSWETDLTERDCISKEQYEVLSESVDSGFAAERKGCLRAGQSTGFDMFFVMGDGDAASVMDIMHAAKNVETGVLSGALYDIHSLTEMKHLSVVAFDENGRAVNQFFTDDDGRFRGTLPPGRYVLKVEREPVVGDGVEVMVTANEESFVRLSVPAVGRANVRVFDDVGRALPAKITIVGVSPPDAVGGESMRRMYQFDLSVGQHWRHGDLVPDDPNRPETRRFIEGYHYTEDGQALIDLALAKTGQCTYRVDPSTKSRQFQFV